MVPGFLVNGNALPIVEFGDMQDLMPLWEPMLAWRSSSQRGRENPERM